ncbi:hypothetical protein L3Y34_000218 [Caenorhabditis briggsae]|uniref:RING-type domain-containing protein n=1 Tax=Caenorhabditis briggsae TaxID=6238 RepID=A0AAE9ILH3_CAEBR|nr:hypothetical protein L3Y34_000218 [Caenorhabditis briggsae]
MFSRKISACATCPEVDLSKAELIPVGSMISKEEAITADGCKETTIRCSYTPTPGTVALSSSLNGILADGMTPHIGELPSPGIGKDYSILTCQNNGDYITSRGVMFDICGFSKNTLTDCYSIFHSIVVFLLVTVHFFYLIFAEINYLNFLIAGGLLIFISSSTLLIFGFYCVLKKFLGWLKVKKTTKNQVFMIFALLGYCSFGIAPRVLVFWFYGQTEILVFMFYASLIMPIFNYQIFTKSLNFDIAYLDQFKKIITLIIIHFALLTGGIRYGALFFESPNTVNMILAQIIFAPMFLISSIDLIMIIIGKSHLNVIYEQDANGNQVAPINTIEMDLAGNSKSSFECKICFNEYSENRLPRFLIGCDHTICQECAQKCFDLKHKKYITCPFCQMPTVIKGNVLILPTNLALMEVIDEVKKKT